MPSILETVAMDAQANAKQFADWLDNNNMKVGVFQIGPYQITESANATVGLTTELLEARRYRVDVQVNILTASAHPTTKALVLTAMAILVVRAPAVVAPLLSVARDVPKGAPFDP